MQLGGDPTATQSESFASRPKETLRLARLAVALTYRTSPDLFTGILLLTLVQAVLPPLQLALSRLVLDRAGLELGLTTPPDALAARLPLLSWIILAAAAIAVGQLIQPFISTFQSMAGDKLTGAITGEILRASNRWQGLARFEDPGFADDLERARNKAPRSGIDIAVRGLRTFTSLATSVALALTLVGLHPLVPLLLILATLPLMVVQWDFGNRTGNHLYWKTPEARRLQYNHEVVLAPEAAKDVRLYALSNFFGERYDTLLGRTIGELDRLRRRLLGPMSLASILATAAAGGVYVTTVWLVADAQRSIGDLVLYGGAATLLQTSLIQLGFAVGFMPRVFGFLPSLFRVLEAPPDLPQTAHPKAAPRPIRRGIVFDKVSFSYPGQREPILRGVSFTLKPGESVALVGHNGAGKTTLIKLLLRLYDPTEGRILLDGVDLREYDLDDLRREMGVIFQDFVRFELTAAQNIGLGQVDAVDDQGRIEAALTRARADSVIQKLPEGLETHLGREFGGRELSGGEWQKLALARAFMRDCQVLVLDEPTAALDVQSEYEVYRHFSELTRSHMTILISHRFSTVRMAKHILYLAEGRIQEEGGHEALMKKGGEYARLYQLQAAQYLDAQEDTQEERA